MIDQDRLQSALDTAIEHLIGHLHPDGYWEGHLSSSALSTATAISALSVAKIECDADLIRSGVKWLAETQCEDGGWGDTPDSPSNLSTTLLAASALILAKHVAHSDEALCKADMYITSNAGETAHERSSAIQKIYGDDRTFAVPILMNCAMAGLVSWADVPPLPFELAIFPRSWYKALRLQVVSYALPALIAVGLNIHRNHLPRNPSARLVRWAATKTVLAKLASIQPSNGGFLEATPLTCFVAMSLIPILGPKHAVAAKCLDFARASQRIDGSWPIDTNLSVWVTTSALAALKESNSLDKINVSLTAQWIADCQYTQTHAFTGAAPGGWGWTHLPGGVPDADDTSGAILALNNLGERDAIPNGIKWLLGLQNSDGGWPTFCRGWGKLPFDKSSPDITAHALRALRSVEHVSTKAVGKGLAYLSSSQRTDGSWVPLWFGNQLTKGAANPVFGTVRVLPALAQWRPDSAEAANGLGYLLGAQNVDGGWGGDAGVVSSVEETALAVIALTCFSNNANIKEAVARGALFLIQCIESDNWQVPGPIGLYFASLWYSEAMYPVLWTVEALGRVKGSES